MRVLLVLLIVSAVAGCGGDDTPSTGSDAVGEKQAPRTCVAGSMRPVGTTRRSYAAVVQERAQAYREPSSAPLATFGRENVNGVPTVFAVLAKQVDRACVARWYRVQLPMKPNGIVGWVRASDVELAPVTTRIEVDLSERRVTLFDRGRRVLSATAAIGSPQTPTPTGRYYVNQRLVPADASGPFGPGAIGISAFSEVLTGWTQGGPIAIHGTNRPDLLGEAVSNGCIRVRNDLLRRLFDRTRAGTPVTVHA
ncbi:MAG TPA: L,D-transpeptidase [Gaiellaceae bacterium]|nr:L,D-transpeptidase [Gaiellaceae bacterium]